MNQLGIWIRTTRLDQGWDQAELARESGMTIAQISRIETSNSDITVGSMVHLAYGLDVNILDILSALQNLSTFPRFFNSRPPKQNDIVLKAEDLEAFFKFYYERPDQAKELLISGYQTIQEARIEPPAEKPSEFKTAELIHEATQALSDKYLPIPYPKEILTTQIDELYISGGVISNRDLGAYIRGCRKSFGISLRKLAKQMDFSFVSIARLEKAEIGRISFSEIVKMDSAMQLDGRLIAICWAAGEFQAGIIRNHLAELKNAGEKKPPMGWTPQQLAFADTLLSISRWYLTLLPRQYEWFDQLKQHLSFFTP